MDVTSRGRDGADDGRCGTGVTEQARYWGETSFQLLLCGGDTNWLMP
jgi:hypothetical protein